MDGRTDISGYRELEKGWIEIVGEGEREGEDRWLRENEKRKRGREKKREAYTKIGIYGWMDGWMDGWMNIYIYIYRRREGWREREMWKHIGGKREFERG